MTFARPILLFDADLDTADMYAVGLRLEGFEVVIATGTSAALEYLRRHQTLAIVADWHTAVGEGSRLFAGLNEDRALRAMPIVALTTGVDAELQQAVAGLPNAAVLVKPCLPNDLAAALRAILRGSARTATPTGRVLVFRRTGSAERGRDWCGSAPSGSPRPITGRPRIL